MKVFCTSRFDDVSIGCGYFVFEMESKGFGGFGLIYRIFFYGLMIFMD